MAKKERKSIAKTWGEAEQVESVGISVKPIYPVWDDLKPYHCVYNVMIFCSL